MPNGFRIWFDFRKGKMYWIWLDKITTCEFGPVSAWLEMAIACPYGISYPRTTARSHGTRWPWWNPNRCYPLEDNCLRFQSSAYGRFLLEEDHIILLSVELTCRCICSWCMCVGCVSVMIVWTGGLRDLSSGMFGNSCIVGELESAITLFLDSMMLSLCILWSDTCSPLLPPFWFPCPW